MFIEVFLYPRLHVICTARPRRRQRGWSRRGIDDPFSEQRSDVPAGRIHILSVARAAHVSEHDPLFFGTETC